jgi:hypothetical protein
MEEGVALGGRPRPRFVETGLSSLMERRGFENSSVSETGEMSRDGRVGDAGRCSVVTGVRCQGVEVPELRRSDRRDAGTGVLVADTGCDC